MFINILYIEMVLLSHLGWLAHVQVCLDEARTLLRCGHRRKMLARAGVHGPPATVLLDFGVGETSSTATTAGRKQLDYLKTNEFACYPWRAEIGTRFWQMHVQHTLGHLQHDFWGTM